MQDKDVVGQRIRERREQLGWSQEMLSARMMTRGHTTLHRPRISDIEAGHRYVRPAEVIGFSRVLRVPVTWLLGVPDLE